MEISVHPFKELSAEQVYEMLALRCAVFIVEQECAYQDPDGVDLESYHLAAREGGELFGYLRIIPKGVVDEDVYIGRVIVKRGRRSEGLGREIMQRAIDYVVNALGEREIAISAQTYLTDFYKSLGFEIASEPYFEEGGIKHVRMRLVVG